MVYGDFHRALVQAFLSRRVMTVDEAKAAIAMIQAVESGQEVSPTSITSNMVKGAIEEINRKLLQFDFEVRSGRDQTDRSTIYAFVNNTPDLIIEGATQHTPDEIAFFRRLLDAIFETNNTLHAEVLAISHHDAIHLNKNLAAEGGAGATQGTPAGKSTPAKSGGLTLKGAEEALATFVEDGWLDKSSNNWYTLATRALIELSVYLTQTYEHQPTSDNEAGADAPQHRRAIKKCEACSDILTIGQRCDDLHCEVRMHNPCATQFFTLGRSKSCPKCKKPWSGKQKVGEAAAGQLRKKIRIGAPAKRTGDAAGPSSSKRRKVAGARARSEESTPAPHDDEEEAEEAEEAEEEEEEAVEQQEDDDK